MRVEVSLSLNTFENFSYEIRGDFISVREGMRVVVPLWNRLVLGWIVNAKSEYQGKIKPVLGIVDDEYIPDIKYLSFINEISKTFMISKGKLLDASLSPVMRSKSGLLCRIDEKNIPIFKKSVKELVNLSSGKTLSLFYKKKTDENLNGIDSSKKQIEQSVLPEHMVYLNNYRRDYYNKIWAEEKNRGRTSLILLPNNFSMERYKNDLDELQIYNSMEKIGRREKIWSIARSGNPVFIGGGESALFLPVFNQGTIIIEKPGSFFYGRNISSGIDLRKAARIKAAVMGVDLVEGSSSLTSFHFHNRNSIKIYDKREQELNRVNVKKLDPGTKIPPEQIIEMIMDHFIKGERVLVIVSRKGSKKFLFCTECKGICKCPSCGSSLIFLSEKNINCPSCSYSADEISNCDKCGSELKVLEDLSVKSLKKKLSEKAGDQFIVSFDADNKKGDKDKLKRPLPGDNNIAIVTPGETGSIPEKAFDHVVIIKPESFFDLNNYNGGEQIYLFIRELEELLTPGGKVDVYSVFHFHYCLKLINDEEKFFKRELKYRELFKLPPYFEVFNLKVSDRDIRKLAKRMRDVINNFSKYFLIKKSYLISRSKIRGFYQGNLQIHTDQKKIYDSGIMKVSGIKIKGINN